MGNLLFWRKTQDTGEYRPDGIAQTRVTEVTREEPLPVQIIHPEDNEYPPFRIPEDAGYQAPIAGEQRTYKVPIPGIGTGSIYAAGDSFGTIFQLPNVFRGEKCSGTLVALEMLDLDDEGSQVDVAFYSESHSPTADNSANASADSIGQTCLKVVEVNYFVDMGGWQIGYPSTGATGLPQWIKAPSPNLWVHCVTRATPTIAAGSIPELRFTFIPD